MAPLVKSGKAQVAKPPETLTLLHCVQGADKQHVYSFALELQCAAATLCMRAVAHAPASALPQIAEMATRCSRNALDLVLPPSCSPTTPQQDAPLCSQFQAGSVSGSTTASSDAAASGSPQAWHAIVADRQQFVNHLISSCAWWHTVEAPDPDAPGSAFRDNSATYNIAVAATMAAINSLTPATVGHFFDPNCSCLPCTLCTGAAACFEAEPWYGSLYVHCARLLVHSCCKMMVHS